MTPSLLRRGASKGSYVCASAAPSHQRPPLQHPVHHHHTRHAHGRGLPVLQHQEPQPQVSIRHWWSTALRVAGWRQGLDGRCSEKINEGLALREREKMNEWRTGRIGGDWMVLKWKWWSIGMMINLLLSAGTLLFHISFSSIPMYFSWICYSHLTLFYFILFCSI